MSAVIGIDTKHQRIVTKVKVVGEILTQILYLVIKGKFLETKIRVDHNFYFLK